MSFPNVKHLEEDLTGVNPSNYIDHDIREIPSAANNRVICLRYGKFYTKTLKLFTADGKSLIPWKQFKPVAMDVELTGLSGKTVSQFVEILDNTVMGTVNAKYQAVGGEIGMVKEDLIDIYQAYAEDDRDYYWKDILGKSTEFNPSYHTHKTHDLTNQTNTAEALARFRAVLANRASYPDLKTLKAELDNISKRIDSESINIRNIILNHDSNKNNPHQNKHGMTEGLENVDNFPMASLAVVKEGKSNVHFVSPKTAADAAMTILLKNDESVVHVGKVPMLQFGDLTDNPIPVSFNKYVLTIPRDVPAIFGGREYMVPASVIDITKFVANPANKTLFIYVRVTPSTVGYEIASETAPEKTTYINVGSIKTNGSAIVSAVVNKVTGLGTFRVSEEKIGSAIAATKGLPSQPGTFDWIN